jgi:hypothetical protein
MFSSYFLLPFKDIFSKGFPYKNSICKPCLPILAALCPDSSAVGTLGDLPLSRISLLYIPSCSLTPGSYEFIYFQTTVIVY